MPFIYKKCWTKKEALALVAELKGLGHFSFCEKRWAYGCGKYWAVYCQESV